MGRRRGRRTGSQRRARQKAKRASRSPSKSSTSSKSNKSKSKKRSTAASKRKKVRSVAKAARAAKRAAKTSTSTSSSTSSSKTKRKPRKIKLNKKDRQRQAQENAKKAFKKKNEQQKKKTISASQSRKQVRQKTKEKIATRKKINLPSLGQVGRFTRNLRQPVTALSNMAINSVLGRPGIASTIAQAAVNNLGAQNARTRDMSKLSPQQQRKYQRLSEKTGRDYSIRNPTFRLNMNMRDIARFAGLDKQGWYSRVPASIRNAQVNKQFYGNPMKKGWHSSQRTGRGQGLTDKQGVLAERISKSSHPEFVHSRRDAAGLPSLRLPMRDEMSKSQMGPQQDWLSQLYSSHNISGGKLDQEARDYWSNEAKTKGRDAVMQSIIGTSKAQGTYGGRKKPQRITTGSTPNQKVQSYLDARFAGSGHQYNKKAHNLKKRNMKSIAATIAGIRGGVG